MQLEQILLHAPCPIFWKGLNGRYLGCNKMFLEMSGLKDYTQLVGERDADMCWKKYADKYTEDDHQVMTSGETLIDVERILLYNEQVIISETTKSPLIQDNKIIRVLGACFDTSSRHMYEHEIHKAHLNSVAEKLGITMRERECAEHLVLGKTANEIAERLQVSPRTVETHIEHIKNKLGCYRKSEVITHLLKAGFRPSVNLLS